MLKLTYTDVGLHTERIFVDPEVLIAQRAILALRLGQTPVRCAIQRRYR
ncbi:MAG: hypothetical protein AAFW84_04410 [Cyanobacteria bacterium J06635_15]